MAMSAEAYFERHSQYQARDHIYGGDSVEHYWRKRWRTATAMDDIPKGAIFGIRNGMAHWIAGGPVRTRPPRCCSPQRMLAELTG